MLEDQIMISMESDHDLITFCYMIHCGNENTYIEVTITDHQQRYD